jgi:hypothetical protein
MADIAPNVTPASGGAAPSSAPPVSSPTPDAGAASSAGQQPNEGMTQLRTAYDKLKSEFEPFSKLNLKPDQIQQHSTVYQKTFEEAASVGRSLGYPDDQIVEALLENPVATLDFLRDEAFKRTQGQQQPQQQQGVDLNDLVERAVGEQVGPVREWHNTQLTEQANARFESTVQQLAAAHFKSEGLDIANVPEDEMSMLMSAASEILKYDGAALKALKFKGETAPIQRAFKEAVTMLDKYYLARTGRSGGAMRPAAQPGRPAAQANGKKPSLDDMINNPGVINSKYDERA